MRTLSATCAAVAAVGWAAAGPGAVNAGPPPGSGAGLTLPPHAHPGWPGWPQNPWPRPPLYPPYPRPPVPPYPGPRPPEVRISYAVYYRPGPFAPWRVYARYPSAARAQAAAARLRAHGYQTEVVVTY